MASSMARLAVILSIFSSLFLLSLARIPNQPDTQIEILLPEDSNTTAITINPNEGTVLEILDPVKKIEEEKDAQLGNLELPDESYERQVVEETDPGMTSSEVIGLGLREDEEKKEEKIVMKKKAKRMDDSDSDSDSDSNSESDSDSDSDDEEDGKDERRKKMKNRGKKGGFLRRFLKWINIFD